MQVWLQEYAWTEATQEQQIASRNARANTEQEEAALSKQPLFCFETALKLHGGCRPVAPTPLDAPSADVHICVQSAPLCRPICVNCRT